MKRKVMLAVFTALLTEYSKAPEVTKKRIYLETIQEVLRRRAGQSHRG